MNENVPGDINNAAIELDIPGSEIIADDPRKSPKEANHSNNKLSTHPNLENRPKTLPQKKQPDKKPSFSDILTVNKQESCLNLSAERDPTQENNGADGKQLQQENSLFQENNSAIFNESSIKIIDAAKNGQAQLLPPSMSFSMDILNEIATKNNMKSVCALCGQESKIIQQESQESPAQSPASPTLSVDSLIYPCLCHFQTHRDCLRAYILSSKRTCCKKCLVAYALDTIEADIPFKKQPRALACFFTLFTFLILSLGAMSTGIVILVSPHQFVRLETQLKYFWLIVTVISGLGISLIWICALFRLKKAFKKTIIKDLVVYCKQSEVDKHTSSNEEILEKFIEYEKKQERSEKLDLARKKYKTLNIQRFNELMKSKNYFEGVYHQHSNDPLEIKNDFESLIVSRCSFLDRVIPLDKTESYIVADSQELAENTKVNKIFSSVKISNELTFQTADGGVGPSKEGTKEKIRSLVTRSRASSYGGLLNGSASAVREGYDSRLLRITNSEASPTSRKKCELSRVRPKEFLNSIEAMKSEFKLNTTSELQEIEIAECS